MKIPKIIHQIWFGDQDERPFDIMNKVKEMNPTWEYVLWTEKELKDKFGKLINQDKFDSLINLYDNLKLKNTQLKIHHYLCGQSDLARYEILYKYGGFFIDADAYPIKPLTDDFCNNLYFSVYENEIVRNGLIANGYLASHKYGDFMKDLIQEIKRKDNILYDEPWITTGPKFLTDMIRKYKVNIKIYPSHYFIPRHYTGIQWKGDYNNVYFDQLWGSTKNIYNKL